MNFSLALPSSSELESRVESAFRDENSYSQVQRAKFKSVEQYHDYARFSQVNGWLHCSTDS